MVHVYDVLIIGGGAAGLSMATALARQAYSALVIDNGVYRNARAAHTHNVPGFDHVPPADFLAKVRADLVARYESIAFRDETTIVEVRQRVAAEDKTLAGAADARFEATDSEGNVYYGKKLGLATGVRDKVEEQVEGYAECWGRGIFHCLFCDGFEERGAFSVGVLGVGLVASGPALAHASLLAKRLAAHTTIYTSGDAAVAAALPPSHLADAKRSRGAAAHRPAGAQELAGVERGRRCVGRRDDARRGLRHEPPAGGAGGAVCAAARARDEGGGGRAAGGAQDPDGGDERGRVLRGGRRGGGDEERRAGAADGADGGRGHGDAVAAGAGGQG